jgi:hypothetical protein
MGHDDVPRRECPWPDKNDLVSGEQYAVSFSRKNEELSVLGDCQEWSTF